MYLPKEMSLLLLYTELDVKPHALGRETHTAPKVYTEMNMSHCAWKK